MEVRSNLTTKEVGTARVIDDEARLAKNAAIAATQKATRAKRAGQLCRVYDLKVVDNKLSSRQREALKMVFVEAKWIRNAALGHEGGPLAYELGPTVTVLTRDRTPEERPFRFLGSQMKQSTLAQVRNDLKALGASKSKGRKVGRLGFCTEVASLDLKQHGNTYRFDASKPSRVKVQNIPGRLTVRGTGQFTADHEFANAKLVNRPDGYHLLVTTHVGKTSLAGLAATTDFQPGTRVGMDMGVKTHITLSDGTKIDALFGETDRLKRLQRKLSRQTKGSNGRALTLGKIRKEHQYITRRRDDCANKIVHELLSNERVFIQDENISSWKMRSGYIRGGKRIHGSVLGRVKAKLIDHDRVTVLSRHAATTATCICGRRTKTPVQIREFECRYCGHAADRDTHAALNMIRMSATPIPVERRESTRAETDAHREAVMNFGFINADRRSLKHEASGSLDPT